MRTMIGVLILTACFPYPCLSQDEEVVEQEVVEQVEVMAELAAPGFAVPAPNANIVDQLRPLMNVELGFVKRVCKPTEEQKRAIAAAAEKCLEGMGDMAGGRNAGMVQGFQGRLVVARDANGRPLSDNPWSRIRGDLAEAIRPLLSEQQLADYTAELEKRAQFRREAAVGITVALLDRHLALTVQQQEALTARLLEKWPDAENLAIETYMHNPQYVPPVPEAIVQRELDDAQKRVWKSLRKAQFTLQLSNGHAESWDEDFLE